jgi:hypothetical protein
VLGSIRVRHLGTVLATTVFAAALALGAVGGRLVEDDCCEVAGCEGEIDGGGASEDCPPGCDDGCACCARGTAVPAAEAPRLGAQVIGSIEYPEHIELPPGSPDPRERDLVPRPAAALAI